MPDTLTQWDGVTALVCDAVGRPIATVQDALDLVHESNRGQHIWFVADLDELDARLT